MSERGFFCQLPFDPSHTEIGTSACAPPNNEPWHTRQSGKDSEEAPLLTVSINRLIWHHRMYPDQQDCRATVVGRPSSSHCPATSACNIFSISVEVTRSFLGSVLVPLCESRNGLLETAKTPDPIAGELLHGLTDSRPVSRLSAAALRGTELETRTGPANGVLTKSSLQTCAVTSGGGQSQHHLVRFPSLLGFALPRENELARLHLDIERHDLFAQTRVRVSDGVPELCCPAGEKHNAPVEYGAVSFLKSRCAWWSA